VIFSRSAIVCHPFSADASNLNGWNASLEKKYLRYFGEVSDLGGQSGSLNEHNLLFGLRGGASI